MDFIFKFSDYLRLFLFLKLSADSDNVMLRIADVIQLNVGTEFKLNNPKVKDFSRSKGTSFCMNEAFTYVEIDTDIQDSITIIKQYVYKWFRRSNKEIN